MFPSGRLRTGQIDICTAKSSTVKIIIDTDEGEGMILSVQLLPKTTSFLHKYFMKFPDINKMLKSRLEPIDCLIDVWCQVGSISALSTTRTSLQTICTPHSGKIVGL